MLVDTNVLASTLQPHHPMYNVTERAFERLLEQGQELNLVPQNLIELWVVATRPIEQNGLGMPIPEVASELERLKNMFVLLPDTASIYPIWENLVSQYRVSGKPAHDARLVAAMKVHGITAVLTFDKKGFSRYDGIEVVHPADVATTA